jgi:hypothetical protein
MRRVVVAAALGISLLLPWPARAGVWGEREVRTASLGHHRVVVRCPGRRVVWRDGTVQPHPRSCKRRVVRVAPAAPVPRNVS